MPAALEVIRDPSKASALLSPARLQVLERLAEPDSASNLSRQLGIPRQKINYHLRELESEGLVEFIEERRRGNCLGGLCEPARGLTSSVRSR
jgi:DNA-binding transcriptional ArsR family regulator